MDEQTDLADSTFVKILRETDVPLNQNIFVSQFWNAKQLNNNFTRKTLY